MVRRLQDAGVEVRVLAEEAEDIGLTGVQVCAHDGAAAAGTEVVLVLGGDGSILRSAELAREAQVPLLGVNLGRVGFLAAAESEDLDETVERGAGPRVHAWRSGMTLDVTVHAGRRAVDGRAGRSTRSRWRRPPARGCSRWSSRSTGARCRAGAATGVVAATPTGSTAYAFSAGGPVVWPDVEALTLVPISAHALFARPIVVAPTSRDRPGGAGQRRPGGAVRRRPAHAAAAARGAGGGAPRRSGRCCSPGCSETPFTDTLVRKFGLPVEGWRGAAERRSAERPDARAPLPESVGGRP